MNGFLQLAQELAKTLTADTFGDGYIFSDDLIGLERPSPALLVVSKEPGGLIMESCLLSAREVEARKKEVLRWLDEKASLAPIEQWDDVMAAILRWRPVGKDYGQYFHNGRVLDEGILE